MCKCKRSLFLLYVVLAVAAVGMFDFDEIEDVFGKEEAQARAETQELQITTSEGDALLKLRLKSCRTTLDVKASVEQAFPSLQRAQVQLELDGQLLQDGNVLTELCKLDGHTVVLLVCTVSGVEHRCMLKNSDSRVRCRAAKALGRSACFAAAQADVLVERLQDDKEAATVRAAAAKALSALGKGASIYSELLAGILKDADEHYPVRVAAAKTLTATGEQALPLLAECLEDIDDETRSLSAEALGRIGSSAAPYITTSLGCKDPKICLAALNAYACMGQPAEGPLLKAILACLEGRDDVRSAAVEACLKANDVGSLTAFLGNEDGIVSKKRFVVGPLIKIGHESVPHLLPLLNSKHWYARYKAINLLSFFGISDLVTSEHIEKIRKLTKDANALVSREARNYLRFWGYTKWEAPPQGSQEHNDSPRRDNALDSKFHEVGSCLHDTLSQPIAERKKIMKQLMFSYHPDKNDDPSAKEVFQYLNNSRSWYLSEER